MYGVSVVDMRHGLAPYTGVFSAQGPLHFPLLYVGDLIGLRTLDGPRVTPMLAGVASGSCGAGRSRAASRGTKPDVIAGVLVATSGTMIWTTGQVTGDGPAAGLALVRGVGRARVPRRSAPARARWSPASRSAPRSQ